MTRLALAVLVFSSCARRTASSAPQVAEAPETAPAPAPRDEEAERVDRQLKMIFGKTAQDVRDYATQVAPFSEFNRSQILFALLFLGEAGFRGQDLPRALAAALDVAALSIAKERGLSEALDALAEIRKSERVGDFSLRKLGIGIGAYQRAAASRGASASDVTSELETIYVLIAKKTGKPLGNASVAMSGH